MPLNLQQHSLACLNHRSVNRHKNLGHVAFGLKDTKIDLFCTIQTWVCSCYLSFTLCLDHYSFISTKREASITTLAYPWDITWCALLRTATDGEQATLVTQILLLNSTSKNNSFNDKKDTVWRSILFLLPHLQAPCFLSTFQPLPKVHLGAIRWTSQLWCSWQKLGTYGCGSYRNEIRSFVGQTRKRGHHQRRSNFKNIKDIIAVLQKHSRYQAVQRLFKEVKDQLWCSTARFCNDKTIRTDWWLQVDMRKKKKKILIWAKESRTCWSFKGKI